MRSDSADGDRIISRPTATALCARWRPRRRGSGSREICGRSDRPGRKRRPHSLGVLVLLTHEAAHAAHVHAGLSVLRRYGRPLVTNYNITTL